MVIHALIFYKMVMDRLKNWLLILLLSVLFSYPLAAADLGSLLITHQASLYLEPSMKGRHLLTRLKKAYQVTGIKALKDKMIFEIIYPGRTREVSGNGFILNTELTQGGTESQKINVYSELPERSQKLIEFNEMPIKDIQVLSQRSSSPDFPEVEWIPVSYKTRLPQRFWVYSFQGIYRPEKSVTWSQNTYSQLIRLKYSGEILQKLLQGMVEVGFTKLEVRLALGSPISTVKLDKPESQEWTYQHLKITFKNDKVVSVQ